MSQDLEETFGQEFAEQYQQEVQKRRQERESIDEESAAKISDLAVNQDKFKGQGDEPHFMFTSDDTGITHDVLLMELPDPQNDPIWEYVNKLDSGAVTCPMSYMGEWMSCLFNDPDDLKKLEPGDFCIVIGEMGQYQSDKTGEVHDQVSPVRGVITMEEAKALADKELDESSINEEEQTSDDEEETSSEEEGSSGGGFSLGGDDSSEDEDNPVDEVDGDEVFSQVEELSNVEPAVWELNEGDQRLDELASTVSERLGYETTDDVVEKVKGICMERINIERQDSEDDSGEDDALF